MHVCTVYCTLFVDTDNCPMLLMKLSGTLAVPGVLPLNPIAPRSPFAPRGPLLTGPWLNDGAEELL